MQHERMIDDFFCVGDRKGGIVSATRQSAELRRTLTLFGFVYKLSKSIAPTRVAKFIGIMFDSEKQKLRMPQDKTRECVDMLLKSIASKKAKRIFLEQTAGFFQHISQVFPQSRPFFRCLHDAAHSVKNQQHFVRVSIDTRKDSKYFLKWMNKWNGSHAWHRIPTVFAATDGSPQGFGGCVFNSDSAHFGPVGCCGVFAARDFKFVRTSGDMQWSEGWAVLGLLLLYGSTIFKGRTVSTRVDNEAIVWILGRYKTKDRRLRILLRAITHLLIENDIVLVVDWVAGILNKIPDFLSRPELHKFNASALSSSNARTFMSSSIHIGELHANASDVSAHT